LKQLQLQSAGFKAGLHREFVALAQLVDMSISEAAGNLSDTIADLFSCMT
jgi:hypothetical protein